MIEKQYRIFAFGLITALFFLGGHKRDAILIPSLKKSLTIFDVQITLFNTLAEEVALC